MVFLASLGGIYTSMLRELNVSNDLKPSFSLRAWFLKRLSPRFGVALISSDQLVYDLSQVQTGSMISSCL